MAGILFPDFKLKQKLSTEYCPYLIKFDKQYSHKRQEINPEKNSKIKNNYVSHSHK